MCSTTDTELPNVAVETFLLLPKGQLVDDRVEISTQNRRQIVHRQINTVICNAILRIVIRSYLLAPVASLHLRFPERAHLFLAPLLFFLVEARP